MTAVPAVAPPIEAFAAHRDCCAECYVAWRTRAPLCAVGETHRQHVVHALMASQEALLWELHEQVSGGRAPCVTPVVEPVARGTGGATVIRAEEVGDASERSGMRYGGVHYLLAGITVVLLAACFAIWYWPPPSVP